MSYLYIWEYDVDPNHIDDFKQLYGLDGGWVALFKKHDGYEFTLLLEDRERPNRFVTVDSWSSAEAHEKFRAAAVQEFDELDARGEGFTTAERNLGSFDSAGNKPR